MRTRRCGSMMMRTLMMKAAAQLVLDPLPGEPNKASAAGLTAVTAVTTNKLCLGYDAFSS